MSIIFYRRKRTLQRSFASLFVALSLITLGIGADLLIQFFFAPQAPVSLGWVLGKITLLALINAGCFWQLRRSIYVPLAGLVAALQQLALSSSTDQSAPSEDLRSLTGWLHTFRKNQEEITRFVETIGKNNLNVSLSVDNQDKMGSAIRHMHHQLKRTAASEQERSWKNQLIGQFVKIIRHEQHNLHVLLQKILSTLVKELQANQGAIFILEEDETPYLEARATFAWGKEKFSQKRIQLTQGLAGQAALEAETLYLTDIPPAYVNITSGLGEANPNQLLIVPMKFNEQVYGVIELASFRSFAQHHIELVETIGESLASSVANIRTNEQTRCLLQESQQMTERMRGQEEELRQNALEMEAARKTLAEELEKATRQMQRQIETIEQERKKNLAILEGCVDGIITFNQQGNMVFINQAAEDIWQVKKEKVIGKTVQRLIAFTWTHAAGKSMPYYLYQGIAKTIDIRTEVTIVNSLKQEIPVLMTISQVQVGEETFYTIFVQKITVELF